MAARLRAAGLEDPRVLEAAAFENAGELVKFLYGDSVPNDAELQEIGVCLSAARAKAGLARRASSSATWKEALCQLGTQCRVQDPTQLREGGFGCDLGGTLLWSGGGTGRSHG